MTGLVATYLQDIRAKYPSQLDRDEKRVTQDGLLTAVLEMTKARNSIVTDDLRQKAEDSEGLNLDVPVLKKGAVTISNVRSCVITGGQSVSAMVRITWKTVSANIVLAPSTYKKNEVKYLADLENKIIEMVEAFKIEMEEDLDTAFNANKNQVYGSTIVGTTYTLTGSAIQVPVALQDFFFNDLEAINYADDYYQPRIKIVASHTVMSVVNKYINQGAGNNTNLSFQFAGKDFTFSNRITVGGGKTATGYFMPDGSIGLLTRVAIDSKMDATATDGTEWSEQRLPNLPFTVGLQYKSKCDDLSAIEASGMGHLTASKLEMWQFSFDYAIVVPYNSDNTTKAGSIRKFDFVP